jgi:Zn-dependent protease/predicted transcriptional regulator
VRTAFRLGRVAGVTVDVNWTVLVIVWLLMWSLASYVLPDWVPGHATAAYWMVGLLAALGLVASILGHELSHAVVAQRNGVPVDGITLWMFGGLAKLGRRASDAGAELRIALAGPAVSVAIGAVCLALAGLSFGVGGPGLFTGAVAWLGMVNLVLAVFNLLPGAPLDGGRVLAAILWRRSGDARWARERAARAGRVLGQVLIGLGVLEFAIGAGVGGLWLAVIGWFLTTSAHAEEVQSETESLFEGVRVADVMTANPRTARADLTVEEFVLRHALTSRVSSFPVVDIDGHLEGLVTLRRLRELPRERWKATTLSRAAVPLDELSVATADELLVDVLRRSGAADGRVLVVDDCQRLVGIVTPTDVTTALDRRTLTRTLDRG